ncbi:MAG: M81 family metallopeptidase [Thermomicrobiales bacterium]
MGMRVLFGGFAHETNTFSPWKTGSAEFRSNGYYVGEEIRQLADTNTGAAGVMRAAAVDHDVELILTTETTAIPGGYVSDEIFDEVVGSLVTAIERDRPDAIVLDLHGAMVTESEVDGDGAILRRVRHAAGPEIPIVAELDLHANVGSEMLENATMLVPYDTYPHIDNAERGEEIFRLAVDAARGKTQPVMASRRLPMILAGPKQFSGVEPTTSIMERVHEVETRAKVLTAGVCFAFPWADCPFAGMTVTVATDGDEQLAQRYADEIGDLIWSRREEFRPETMSVEEAVHAAMASERGPVVLADLGDNPGGGSAADGTALLWALLDLGARNAAVASIADPQVVDQAFAIGTGGHLETQLGAKADRLHGYPIDVSATVVSLSDGSFRYEGPMLAGVPGTLGRTAVLRCDGRHGNSVDVIVCERRVQALDTAVLRSQGIEPAEKDILVLKSAVHFRGAFMPIASRIIEVDTPGLTSIDFSRFPYTQLPRPIWPLDSI